MMRLVDSSVNLLKVTQPYFGMPSPNFVVARERNYDSSFWRAGKDAVNALLAQQGFTATWFVMRGEDSEDFFFHHSDSLRVRVVVLDGSVEVLQPDAHQTKTCTPDVCAADVAEHDDARSLHELDLSAHLVKVRALGRPFQSTLWAFAFELPSPRSSRRTSQ